MKSKGSLLSVRMQLLRLSALTLRAESWPTDTAQQWLRAEPGPRLGCGIRLVTGRYIPSPFRGCLILPTWEVRDVFSSGPSFVEFKWPQRLSNLTRHKSPL